MVRTRPSQGRGRGSNPLCATQFFFIICYSSHPQYMNNFRGNIFSLEEYKLNKDFEFFQTLFQNKNIKIERIISEGHSSPKGFWYDQEEHEWVILLDGKAKIKFFEPEKTIELCPGDFILIKPHEKHRVEWTEPNKKTYWLAIFFK